MWSILYALADAVIYQIGPFPDRAAALAAVDRAQSEGEFDIDDTRVYLLSPDHRLAEVPHDEVERPIP